MSAKKYLVFSGLKLKEFRSQAGLTLKQLAAISKTDFTVIAKAESGFHVSPQFNTVMRWAKTLNVDVKKLCEKVEDSVE